MSAELHSQAKGITRVVERYFSDAEVLVVDDLVKLINDEITKELDGESATIAATSGFNRAVKHGLFLAEQKLTGVEA